VPPSKHGVAARYAGEQVAMRGKKTIKAPKLVADATDAWGYRRCIHVGVILGEQMLYFATHVGNNRRRARVGSYRLGFADVANDDLLT